MSGRETIQIPPGGALNPSDVASKLQIADNWVLQEFTPASAVDTSAPNIRFAFDASFFYVQLETGQWRRAAHSTW